MNDVFDKTKLNLDNIDFVNLLKDIEAVDVNVEFILRNIYDGKKVNLSPQEKDVLNTFINKLRQFEDENEKQLVLMYDGFKSHGNDTEKNLSSDLEFHKLEFERYKFDKEIIQEEERFNKQNSLEQQRFKKENIQKENIFSTQRRLEKDREEQRKWWLKVSYGAGIIFVIVLVILLYRWVFCNPYIKNIQDIEDIKNFNTDILWHMALVFILPATTILFCMIRSATHKPVKNDNNEADTPQLEALKQALEVVEKARDIVTMKKSDK